MLFIISFFYYSVKLVFTKSSVSSLAGCGILYFFFHSFKLTNSVLVMPCTIYILCILYAYLKTLIMKVLRVINSLGLGGAERSLDTNVPVHISHGLEMDILLLNGERTPFYENLESKGVKIINSYKCSIYNPIHIIKVIKLLRRYDIVHAHLFPSFYWVALAKLLSFNHRTKLVFTEHSTSNRRMQNHFFKPFDLFIYRFYDIIISISDATTQNLSGYLGEGKRIITIPNGVDLRPYQIEWIKQPLFDSADDVVIVTQVAGFRIEKIRIL